MTDQFNPIESDNVALFTKLFSDSMSGIYAQMVDRFEKIEKSVEDVEKQLATLILGYGEQAVFMEALVAQVAFAGDDARQKFHDDINEARRNMLEVMRDASQTIMADDNQNLAAALGDLAEQQLSDTAD
jgi:hypothetical protein